MWVTCHSFSTTIFHSYLLSASGLNTTPVVSSVGDVLVGVSALKFSSNGKKLALITYTSTSAPTTSINVHDFDNSTGQVSSNLMRISNGPFQPLGMEFSPDGTKLYCTSGIGFAVTAPRYVYQWDLCAGTELAINTSKTTLSAIPTQTIQGTSAFGFMQVAPDGKIYLCLSSNNQYIPVINQPNLAGAVCGFSLQGLNLAPLPGNGAAFPNFPASYFRNLGASLESSITCQQVQFNVPGHAQVTNGCAATNYPLLGTSWNFGDNASTSNTSNIANPSHYYSSTGTYTAQVILQYNCRADTFKKVISIVDANPTFSISGRTTICVKETSTLNASPGSTYTYSWSTGASTSSIVVTNTISTNFTLIATASNSCVTTKIIPFVVNKCLGFNQLDSQNSFKIYPNPAKESIRMETETKLNVSIFNKLGELILQKENVDNGQEINLSELAAGLYFVRVSNNTWSQVKPLIKE
jgi:hypothetical protein